MTANNGKINNHRRSEELKQWIEARVKGQPSVHLPTLAHEAVDHFEKDEDFRTDILAEVLHPAVYEIAKHILGEGRPKSNVVVVGDEALTREEFEGRAGQLRKRWAKWWEHAGDQHYYFMKMNAKQLITAAKEREQRARTELFVATFERRLAKTLKEDEVVEDRYTEDQLEELWQETRDDLRGESA